MVFVLKIILYKFLIVENLSYSPTPVSDAVVPVVVGLRVVTFSRLRGDASSAGARALAPLAPRAPASVAGHGGRGAGDARLVLTPLWKQSEV